MDMKRLSKSKSSYVSKTVKEWKKLEILLRNNMSLKNNYIKGNIYICIRYLNHHNELLYVEEYIDMTPVYTCRIRLGLDSLKYQLF